MALTPNISLPIPSGSTFQEDVRTVVEIIDGYLHTGAPTDGLKLNAASLDIDQDVSFGGAAASDLKFAGFTPTSTTFVSMSNSLFVNSADNDLYFRTNSGNLIRFTINGGFPFVSSSFFNALDVQESNSSVVLASNTTASVVAVDTSGGNRSITLPASSAQSPGRMFIAVDTQTNLTGSRLSLVCNGSDTIDGQASRSVFGSMFVWRNLAGNGWHAARNITAQEIFSQGGCTFFNDVTVRGTFISAGNMRVSGTVTMVGNVTMTGNTTLGNASSDTVSCLASVVITDPATISSTGDASFLNDVTLGFNKNDDLIINSHVRSDLVVSGSTIVSGTLSALAGQFVGTLTAVNDMVVGDEMTVVGTANLEADSFHAGTAHFSGSSFFNGPAQFGTICGTALTPPVISSNQNDYNPAGGADNTVWRLSTNNGTTRTITGIENFPYTNCFRILLNVGPGEIVVTDLDPSSNSTNRVILKSAALHSTGFSIEQTSGSMGLYYDDVLNKWRQLW